MVVYKTRLSRCGRDEHGSMVWVLLSSSSGPTSCPETRTLVLEWRFRNNRRNERMLLHMNKNTVRSVQLNSDTDGRSVLGGHTTYAVCVLSAGTYVNCTDMDSFRQMTVAVACSSPRSREFKSVIMALMFPFGCVCVFSMLICGVAAAGVVAILHREFREIVQMFAISNIEQVCEKL